MFTNAGSRSGRQRVAPGLTLLGSYIATGSTSIADFVNIPDTYKDLVIVASVRTATAIIVDSLKLTVNGLTTGIYDRNRLANNAGSLFADGTFAAAFLDLITNGDGATTNVVGATNMEIIDYAGAIFQKKVFGRTNVDSGTTNTMFSGCTDGNIRLTSAINRVTLTAGGNMKLGSKIYLYGRT